MSESFLKNLALHGISRGLRLPQAHIERLNELGFLKALLAQLSIDCVLDVGANRGQFAKELRGIGYAGRIVSFEPISSEYAAMEGAFQSDLNWKGFQIALGSKSLSMDINVPRLTVLSSLLEAIDNREATRREQVEVRRLDSILPGLLSEFGASRFFLKMDTQGYDLEVFRGASGCMSHLLGIQSELSIRPLYKQMPGYLEALAAYEAEGFHLYNLSVVNRTGDGALFEMNCFMRRESPA